MGIALLVWMYLISFVVLVGAEFNALLSADSGASSVASAHANAHQAVAGRFDTVSDTDFCYYPTYFERASLGASWSPRFAELGFLDQENPASRETDLPHPSLSLKKQ